MLNSPSTGSCQYGIGIPHDLTKYPSVAESAQTHETTEEISLLHQGENDDCNRPSRLRFS